MNARLDFMVTIATSPAQQSVILSNVIRSQVTAMKVVLVDFMVTNAHKSAQRIAKMLVIVKTVLVAPVKWDSMETNAIASAMKIVRMAVTV